MTKIVSVDLAIRSENVGICTINETKVVCGAVMPKDVKEAMKAYQKVWRKLQPNSADAAAKSLCDWLLTGLGITPSLIAIDGPQGRSAPGFDLRSCEGVLGTSGRTASQLEETCSGFSWPGLSLLGIALFDALEARGFPRISTRAGFQPKRDKWAAEIYPRASWHIFGLFDRTIDSLKGITLAKGMSWEAPDPSEHDIDAAVGALTMLALENGKGSLAGKGFYVGDNHVGREGFIAVPAISDGWQ